MQNSYAFILEDPTHEQAAMTVDRVLFRAHDRNPVGSSARNQSFDSCPEEVLAGDPRVHNVPFRVVEVRGARAATELFSHGNEFQVHGLGTKPQVGFVELRDIPAIRARANVRKNLHAGVNEQLEELVACHVRMTHGDDS